METESPAAGDARAAVLRDAVDYLRELEGRLRYWYSAAETKAQVVLTLNGVFLAFLTGSTLADRGDLARTTTAFGPETWVFLAGMGAGLAGAVACAVACLLARGVWPGQVRAALARHGVDRGDVHPQLSVPLFDGSHAVGRPVRHFGIPGGEV
jgi:hypothetical protein